MQEAFPNLRLNRPHQSQPSPRQPTSAHCVRRSRAPGPQGHGLELAPGAEDMRFAHGRSRKTVMCEHVWTIRLNEVLALELGGQSGCNWRSDGGGGHIRLRDLPLGSGGLGPWP